MNNTFSVAITWAALLIATPMLASCGQPAETPPLQGATIGGPFTLTNQDGGKTRYADFAGKYRLIYFGYTFCPDVCPLDVQHLMQGFRALEKDDAALAARIQPIFITIDPARDDPKALKAFVSAFHPRLIGLTGSEAEIATVAKSFAIFYKKQPAPAGATGYLMDHSRQAMLFDPDGKPLALISQDAKPDVIEGELKRWAH